MPRLIEGSDELACRKFIPQKDFAAGEPSDVPVDQHDGRPPLKCPKLFAVLSSLPAETTIAPAT